MFTADRSRQHKYRRYARVDDPGALGQIDPKKAADHVRQFLQKTPAGMQELVFQEYFSRLSPQRRQELALVLTQRLPPQYAVHTDDPQQMALGIVKVAQQRPDLLFQVF